MKGVFPPFCWEFQLFQTTEQLRRRSLEAVLQQQAGIFFERKNMAIEWTSDLNTGIDVIDDQHKRIVDYINQLENAVTQSDSHSVGSVLDALADYCLAHFGFEESLQEKAGYALAKPHKVVHETFTKRLVRYREKHNAGEDVAKQLHDMLSTWLVHHIKRDDMAYVSVVKGGIDRMSRDKNDGDWLSRSVKGFFN